MFLHKKTSKPAKKLLKLPLKLDFDESSECLRGSFNVEKHGNGLKTRFKRDIVGFPSPARHVVGYLDDVVYLKTDDGLARWSNGTATVFLQKKSADDVCGCVWRGNFIASGKDFGTYLVKGSQATSLSDNGFSSVTSCADRIFGLYQNEVSYTAAGKADGWEQGQTITLPGVCQAIVSVGEKVYALGNDCYAIVPKADDVEFKVLPFAKNVGTVAKNSVVNVNGAVVFATDKGLYKLTSDKITPICRQLNQAVDLRRSAALLFEGKYYLTCLSQKNVEALNDVTLCIDVDSQEVVGALKNGYDSLGATSTKIIGARVGVCNVFAPGAYDGKYLKSNVDFGTVNKKFLDKLMITTVNDLEVTIRSETETRLYKLKGKNFAQKLFLRDMGWRFSIELYSTNGLDVHNAALFAHTLEEV